jgi:hypothetical protein
LGFVGYYRRFIHNFSKISKPLTDLIPAPNKKKKSKSTATREWKWDDAQHQAFQTLKDHLVSAPILGYASTFLPYELQIDSSGYALGAGLYQDQDGAKTVISYAGRRLSKVERNNPTHKREFMALK